ncbi:MAG TPA: energy transducer TonB [Pyrinomonadaceae bacterium]
MKRVFGLIVILAFASACAVDSLAQSGRVKRTESPKDETKGEVKDEAKDKPQDKARANDDKPLTLKDGIARAIIKSKPNPGYPPEARSYGVRGVVKLRIILGADGKVGDKVEVLEGLPHGVTEEAIKAARRIKFESARKDGRPVSQYVIVFYHFNLY